MLYPSNDLRRGRRRLEEIEEISIIDDLTWDNEYKCFFICVSVQLDKEYPQFPKITISGALSCAGRTKEERLRQRKNCAAIGKDRASPSNDNFLITVRFFGSFPLLFTV